MTAVLRHDPILRCAIDHGDERADGGLEIGQHRFARNAGAEHCQPHRVASRVQAADRGAEISDPLDVVPGAAEQQPGATRCVRWGFVEQASRDAVRHDRDAIRRLPAAIERVGPIDVVQHQQAVGQPRGGGDLGQPAHRIPDAAQPGFLPQSLAVIVDHARVVQLFEPVRSADKRRTIAVAEQAQQPQEQPLGACGVDDVVLATTGLTDDRLPRHPWREELADLPRRGTGTDAVGPHDVAGVPHRLELFAKLVEHLRRAQPRIVGIVADEEDRQAHRRIRAIVTPSAKCAS